MVDCKNIYAFSLVFCLVLVGYLDPYKSSIEQQVSSHHFNRELECRQLTQVLGIQSNSFSGLKLPSLAQGPASKTEDRN